MNEGEHHIEEIHIVGLGVQTTLGRTVLSSSAALRGGLHRLERHPSVIDDEDRPVLVSMASYLSEELSLVERLVELAISGIVEALAPLKRPLEKSPPVPLILGLPLPLEGSQEIEGEVKTRLQQHFEERGLLSSIRTIPSGNSAGLMAIKEAWQIIRRGELPLCLAGGVDSLVTPAVVKELNKNGRLRTRRHPKGLRPGEGAGFCLLSSLSEARWLSSLGRIVAVATTRGERHDETDEMSKYESGEEGSDLWGEVLTSLPEGQKITGVICDMNGEPFRDKEFARSIERSFERFDKGFSFLAPAECWGDVGAASGPLFVATSLAGSRDFVVRDLVWTSSKGGQQCAALIMGEG